MDLSNDNVIHVKDDGIEYIQFKRLLEYKDKITHAITVGIENDYRMPLFNSPKNILTYEQIENNKISYKKFCDSIGINYLDIVKTNQVHDSNIKEVKNKINKDRPDFYEAIYDKTDGFITANRHLALCTTNADCIVLLIYDPIKNIIANVHSGWKGTIKKIAGKAIDKMIDSYSCNPKDIICCISPSIRQCHFEVDEDVKNEFINTFNNIEDVIKKEKTKWYIDTVEINKRILEEKGLQRENIVDSNICTVCNAKQMHSYRGSKHTNGLEIGVIELK